MIFLKNLTCHRQILRNVVTMRNITLSGLALLLISSCSNGIEKPDHKVLLKENKCELREYPALAVVSAPMKSMDKRNESFRSLFRYISGDNEKQQKISMTSPVFMKEGDKESKENGSMSFLIPQQVVKNGSPAPTAKQIEISTINSGKYAVINFKGWRDEAKQQQAEKELTKWVASKGWEAKGKPFFAFYNPPWTPEFMRQNEVWVSVKTTD